MKLEELAAREDLFDDSGLFVPGTTTLRLNLSTPVLRELAAGHEIAEVREEARRLLRERLGGEA